jgi:hypothetical protein
MAQANGTSIEMQTTDPIKSKGKESGKKQNSFFWESYQPSPVGKRSTMAKWDQEVRRTDSFELVIDKNGIVTGTKAKQAPGKQARKLAAAAEVVRNKSRNANKGAK